MPDATVLLMQSRVRSNSYYKCMHAENKRIASTNSQWKGITKQTLQLLFSTLNYSTLSNGDKASHTAYTSH